MSNSVSIIFGTPQHGWLPVQLNFEDFKLELDASDVLNNPVEELCDALIRLKQGKTWQITWWLEPYTYFFYFEKTNNNYTLTISEAYDIEGEREVTKIINGNYDQIILPFKKSLTEFCSLTYEEKHWPYPPNKIKLQQL